MGRSGKIFLIFGVTLALLGGGALFMYLQSVGSAAAQTAPPVNVVVAAVAVPSYKPLTAEQLQLKPMAREAVPPGAVFDLATATGKALSSPAQPGQVILSSSLTEGGFAYSVPKGKRAIAVWVDRSSVLNGLLREGDHVDALFMGNFPQVNSSKGQDGKYADKQSEAPIGKTIAQNLQVLKLQNPKDSGATGAIILPENVKLAGGSAESSGADVWTVILAVTGQEAETVQYAQTNGILSFVVRANGDTNVEDTAGVSEEILNNDLGVPVPLQPQK
ncbi:MAG: Flp pilus assembly protein CpaB [Chloroflexota bacterium]|nr:Flp pilus assembly protein CpaB [Chloroflexota bacterium]